MFAALERSVLPGLTACGKPALAGMALLGLLSGVVVAVAGLNALYLGVSLIACAFVLLDFRIGVVLLILLMPISSSPLIPHAMFGMTGLNPLNLLLIGTLCACLLRGLSADGLGHLLPRPLFWCYLLPIVAAGAIGAQHVGEIPPAFRAFGLIDFDTTSGYIRDMLAKPLQLVLFAVLVAAAVSRSAATERFLVPALISIWAIGLVVIVFVARSGISLEQLSGSTAREFLSVLGMHANDLGRLYVVAYALLLFTWAGSRQTGERLLLLATMGLVVAALLLTFSRSAYAGFLVVNALFVLWRTSAKTLLLFALATAIGLAVLPAAVFERVAVGSGEGMNAISAGRINGLWLPLLPEIARSPVYGSGLGSIMWSAPMRASGGASVLLVTHPHNAYLQALLDMGVAGLVLLCAYFVHVWRSFRTLSRDVQLPPALRGYFQGAAAALLGLFVASATAGSLTPHPEQALLWLAIGMMYGQLNKRPAR